MVAEESETRTSAALDHASDARATFCPSPPRIDLDLDLVPPLLLLFTPCPMLQALRLLPENARVGTRKRTTRQ